MLLQLADELNHVFEVRVPLLSHVEAETSRSARVLQTSPTRIGTSG